MIGVLWLSNTSTRTRPVRTIWENSLQKSFGRDMLKHTSSLLSPPKKKKKKKEISFYKSLSIL